MGSDQLPVSLSPIDEERFGVRSARASEITLDSLPAVMDFCRGRGVALLIARCLSSELRVAQAMEEEGFALMDTLIYYTRDLVELPIPPDTGKVPIRPIRPGEEDDVKSVAAKAFVGFSGHYHADGRLDPKKCDEVYADLAFRLCVSRDAGDEVLVAELDGSIVGFGAWRLGSSEEAEALLGGVVPSARKQGIFVSLLVHGLESYLARGVRRMVGFTQITNTAVQKSWIKVGFQPSYGCYTFHKWFDPV